MSMDLKLDYDPSIIYTKFEAENIDLLCMDIDQVVLSRDCRPLALIETTHCATKVDNPRFIAAIDKRMNGSPQQKLVLDVARLLGVNAYWVTFELDCERFGIRLLDGDRWFFGDKQEYVNWIHSLERGQA